MPRAVPPLAHIPQRLTRLAAHLARASPLPPPPPPPPALTLTMAASSSSTQRPVAPWRDLFLEHVGGMPSPEFVLGTVSSGSGSGSGPGTGTGQAEPEPRARTCIFRGMWADLPVNPKNDAPKNPPGVYAGTDFPTFTTDCRMDKMTDRSQLLAAPGGGAAVEAVWWAKEPATQWRVRGRAYVLGDPDEDAEGSDAARALRARMVRKGEKEEGDWSFAREVTAHFGNLSPGMRGTFRNPPSGQPITLPVDDGLALGQKVTDLQDPIARRNFRVVVMVPSEVDRCDLSDPARGRRWKYSLRGDGEWEKVEVWP
ncbi:pyridoxamine 5'-phosphate oxidase-domain-containing protein [Xylariaceae sp. FL0804]|nr:pyridoxamine 5'-phosphate oxidase-domain-containing protein [Xylariaceae sp. FL0804]